MTDRGMEEFKDQEREINNEANGENGGCGRMKLCLIYLYFSAWHLLYAMPSTAQAMFGWMFCWNNDMTLLDDGIYEGQNLVGKNYEVKSKQEYIKFFIFPQMQFCFLYRMDPHLFFG